MTRFTDLPGYIIRTLTGLSANIAAIVIFYILAVWTFLGVYSLLRLFFIETYMGLISYCFDLSFLLFSTCSAAGWASGVLNWLESLLFGLFNWLVGFLTSSSARRIYRVRVPKCRLTILRAATHKTERRDHDFCLSRCIIWRLRLVLFFKSEFNVSYSAYLDQWNGRKRRIVRSGFQTKIKLPL